MILSCDFIIGGPKYGLQRNPHAGSMGCSQRQMERDKLVSREKSKAIFAVADRVGIHWPIDPEITNQELELLLFRTSTELSTCTLSQIMYTSIKS